MKNIVAPFLIGMLFPLHYGFADVKPIKKFQMKNNGWMEYNSRGPLLVDSVDEVPQKACGPYPVKYFIDHPVFPGNWEYDCIDDPWKKPGLVWLDDYYICPEGYQLDKEKELCIGFNQENKSNGPGQCSVGQPITITTGNMYHVDTDISGELPITRTYNTSTGRWSFNFETSLVIIDTRVTLHEHDGKQFLFQKNNDEWTSDPDVFHQLTAVDEAEAKWLVKFSSNRQVWFDVNGRVIKQQWLDGKAYQYSYEASTATISDTKGNELTLKFNSDNQLIEVNANSSYKIIYQYDAQKRLASVTYPGKKERRFHYENSQFPNHLTGVTNRLGVRSLTWEYDGQGRATVSEIANGKERYSLDYGNNQTTVTNPLGKKTTYYFKNYHGVNNVIKVEGHASANCAAANKDYEYFDNGQLKSKTDWQGGKTTYQYNDRGLATEKVEAAGTPQARITTTTWHDQYRLPILVSEPGKLINYQYTENGQLESTTVTDPGTQITISSVEDYDNDGLSNQQEKELGTSTDSSDTDGDGLTDAWEVQNNTNPLVSDAEVDLDNDGFTTAQELLLGRNPAVKEESSKHLLADSKQDWSNKGKQGFKNWHYGYYDYEKDVDKNYQTTEFISFNAKYWNGSKWDLKTYGSPYLEVGQEKFIPSGPSGGRTNEHWPIKRWVSSYTGLVDVSWLAHKLTYHQGNGFTGKFYINGKLQNQQLVPANDFTGNSKAYQININKGDILDFAISPEGTDGGHSNGWDHGNLYISIDAIPSISASK